MSDIVKSNSKKEIKEFNVVRSVAIVIVLLHHMPDYFINYYDLNYIGIELNLSFINHLNRYFSLGSFVFMTGFLAQTSVDKLGANTLRDVFHYLAKKYVRIMPLYICAYMMFVMLFRDTIEHLNPFSVVSHLLGWQILLASKYCDTVSTLWFIGLVFSYYYSFAFIMLYAKTAMRFVIICLLLLIAWMAGKILLGVGDHRFVLYFPIFIAGVVTARWNILLGLLGGDKRRKVLGVAAVLVVAVGAYMQYVYPLTVLHIPLKPALLSLPSLASLLLANWIMLCFVFILLFLAKYLVSCAKVYRCLCIISYASFCMYLFHRPIWYILLTLYNPMETAMKGCYLVFVGVPLIFITSYCAQYLYDKTIVAHIKNWLPMVYAT
jgi:peptidoglycan/LPS O-acetylase OafA/YrhL